MGRAGTGAAVVLTDPQKGLSILQHADQVAAAQQRYQAQLAAKQQAERLKRLDNALTVKTDTGIHYQGYLDEQALTAANTLYKDYNTAGLDETELARRSAATRIGLEGERLLGKKLDERALKMASAVAEDKSGEVNPASFKQALDKVFYTPEGQLIKPADLDPGKMDAIRQDPTHFNPGAIYKNFVNGVFKASTEDDANAGRFGGTATSSKRTQLFFEQRPDGSVVKDANGTPVVKVSDDLLHLADGNERIRLLLDKEQQGYQQKQAEQAVRINAGASEPVLPNLQRKDLLGHVLTNFGYSKYDESATRVRPLPVPKAPAAEKMAAGEVTATPTTGSLATRSYATARTAMERLTGAPAVTNNVPMVGVSFASASKPFVPAVVDIRGGVILGANGEVTMKPNEKNNKSDMQISGRHFVLEVGGKRVGQSKEYATDQEAYQALLQSITKLTPEQARQATLNPYYTGTIADKQKIKGDGVGKSKFSDMGPPEYYNSKGELISLGEYNDQKKKGESPTISYSKIASEERANVLIPATQAVDAQLRRATKNKWEPTQRSEQERQAMALLRAKGGQVRDPYSTVASRAAAPTARPSAAPAPLNIGVPATPSRTPRPGGRGATSTTTPGGQAMVGSRDLL